MRAVPEDLMRRQLRLRREVSVQRYAVRRGSRRGDTRGTLARMQEELRRLQLELDDVMHLVRHVGEVA